MERERKTARPLLQAGVESRAPLLVDVPGSFDGVPAFAGRSNRGFSQGVRFVPGLRSCAAGDGMRPGYPSYSSRPLSLARTPGIGFGWRQAGRAKNKGREE